MRLIENVEGPIAIGGLGGSGTRVVAQILKEAGVFIGDELNDAFDNLWFTLLFRRPTIKSLDDDRLTPLLELFIERMQGKHKWSLQEQRTLWFCAFEFISGNYVPPSRFRFPIRTLRSFYKQQRHITSKQWGWKEPNTHVFLLLLARRFPKLRYVHVLRHPLDAVFGSNKRQLHNWKHLYGITESNEQRAMLLFHRAANQRAINFGKQLGNRFLLLRIEDLCSDSTVWTKQLLEFANLEVDDPTFKKLCQIPNNEQAKPRYINHDCQALMPLADSVASEFGYSVHQNVQP